MSQRPPSALPAAFYNPLHLLWISVLPLLLLLALNCQAAWFAWNEISPTQQQFTISSLALIAGFALFNLAAALMLKLSKRALTVIPKTVLLLFNIAFIWGNLYLLDKAVPSSLDVPSWIFDYDILFCAQFTLVIPACFYLLVGLSNTPLNISTTKDIVISVVLLIAPPIILLLFLFLFRHDYSYWMAFVCFAIVSSIAMMLGLLRLLTRLYLSLNRYEFVLTLLVALLMPLAGLILNIGIPFPVSFQTIGIYAWTILNAAVLLLACLPKLRDNHLLWLLQVFTFPFTFYFFIVFLPFLPLFLFAMIACGAGFLILTPTVLFMIHGQRILAGFRCSAAAHGRTLTIILTLITISLLPGWFALQAALDRAALRQGLDYVYQSDPLPRATLTTNPDRISNTLLKLQNYQQGQYLPILSNFYNWSVFDNLFLPDDKLKEMYHAFTGKELPAAKSDTLMARSIFNETNRHARMLNQRLEPRKFPHELITANSEIKTKPDGDCTRATLTLILTNNANTQNEYAAKLQLSPGVMVSALRLHIDGKPVDGKLFEKKTALWVYKQIRDQQRRDPAILYYTANNEVELRVFPLEPKNFRRVEIEFLYPTNSPASVTFDNKNILPAGRQPQAQMSLAKFSDRQTMLFMETPNNRLMIAQKKYYHFIIEHSDANHELTTQKILEKIHTATDFAPYPPTVENAKITLANYESKLLTPNTVKISDLADTLTTNSLREFPARGGFLINKVLKEEILNYEQSLNRRSKNFDSYPLFIIISANPLKNWQPDAEVSSLLASQNLDYRLADAELSKQLLTAGSYRRAMIVAAGDQVHAFDQPGRFIFANDQKLVTNNPLTGEFEPIPQNTIGIPNPYPVISVVENETYKLGAQVFALQDELYRHPSRTTELQPQLVKLSKQSGIMAPATSYIVVERSVQWKILSEKEKQKLGANQQLELEDPDSVPEPAAIWLLASGFLILVIFRVGKRIFNH